MRIKQEMKQKDKALELSIPTDESINLEGIDEGGVHPCCESTLQ